VWKELNAMFSSQSRAWTIQLRTHLATTCKGDQSAAVYYNKMKGFIDEMAVVGKPLEDEDFISYVLAGLDQDYNSFMENVTGKDEISLGVLYSQFLSAEASLELQSSQYQSSTKFAACGRGSYCGHGGRQGDGGGHGGFGRGFDGRGEAGSRSGTRLVYQLCKKTCHMVLRC
jgi:hypothetical protein